MSSKDLNKINGGNLLLKKNISLCFTSFQEHDMLIICLFGNWSFEICLFGLFWVIIKIFKFWLVLLDKTGIQIIYDNTKNRQIFERKKKSTYKACRMMWRYFFYYGKAYWCTDASNLFGYYLLYQVIFFSIKLAINVKFIMLLNFLQVYQKKNEFSKQSFIPRTVP
jgi:hypothetical protein